MVSEPPGIRPATHADLEAINRIYNHEVRTGVATWDEQPWPATLREAWFADRDPATEPVLVAVRAGSVVGFGYLSQYRARSGYRFTREDTLYIDPAHQRHGVGRALLAALIAAAREAGMHTLVAVIEAENVASIELHAHAGFTVAGRKREAGFKFARWLDVVELQLLL